LLAKIKDKKLSGFSPKGFIFITAEQRSAVSQPDLIYACL